jgi:hypothetical protein
VLLHRRTKEQTFSVIHYMFRLYDHLQTEIYKVVLISDVYISYILASCCTVLFNGFCRLCCRLRARGYVQKCNHVQDTEKTSEADSFKNMRVITAYTPEDGHIGRNM